MLTTEQDNINTESAADGSAVISDTPYVNTSVKRKEVPEYSRSELVLIPLSFLFSFVFIRYVLFYVTGAVSTLLYLAITTTAVVYLKKKGYAFSGFNKLLTVVVYLFSFVFTITANSTVKFFNGVFLFGAGAYLIFSVCAGRNDVDRYLPYALKRAVFEYPMNKFSSAGDILSDSTKNSEASTNIKRIIGGLLLAAPVTIIVGSLLMAADDGIDHLFNNLFLNLDSENIITFIRDISIALPCGFYLFGMFYRNAVRKDIKELTDMECDYRLMKKRALGNLVFYTAAAPILILYVMFFVSQASYFLSAFMGKLPEEFSYAEYARKGFFELCWIVVINLGIMMIMNLHSKNSGKEKTGVLKAYNIIFCIFTLILIATAVSKMVMYIDVYGLTVLRVYTTWFMLLCAFIFLVIFIKQFKPDMHMSRWISVGFTLMFAVLCFSRAEALIVKYNHAMGKVSSDTIRSSGILEMSDDGLLEAVNEGLISIETAKSASDLELPDHPTDVLNISTILLQSK